VRLMELAQDCVQWRAWEMDYEDGRWMENGYFSVNLCCCKRICSVKSCIVLNL
jgi:hypothetical protein